MTDLAELMPWTQPGWLDRISAWIHTELDGQGIGVDGPIAQVQAYPWSIVLRVPTSGGDIYCKATSPLTMHEPALLLALAGWRPRLVADLIAVDIERGWVLMHDAGPPITESLRTIGGLDLWLQVVSRYAELQIAMVERVPALLALGVPDWRLPVFPGLYDQLLIDLDTLRIDRTPGMTSLQHERLLDLSPRVNELCAELAGHRIPETLNHGDFHDGNILIADGRFVFADWGESAIAHPFYALRIPLAIARRFFKNAPDTERKVRDAYLEPWTRYEPHADLLLAVDAASRLANVNDALVWHRTLAKLHGPLKEEHAEPVPALLLKFLVAETVASE